MSRLAVALLAAGASRRFGPADKLLAPLQGRPLCLHAAGAAGGLAAEARWAVVPDREGPVARLLTGAGYTCLDNPDAGAGQGTSVACAARAAKAAGMDRLLVLLADMPFVAAAHLQAVASAGRDHDGVMSRAGPVRLPPACFSASVLARLAALDGETGAGAVFKALECRAEIAMLESMARDIDTVADWEAAGAAVEIANG